MKLDVLISTMNKKEINEDFLNARNITSGCIIVNQNVENNKKIVMNNKTIVYSDEIGLSKSRNMAINNSRADICLICDDDIVLNDNYEDTIIEAYKQYEDADAITFLNTFNTKLNNKLKSKKVIKHNRFSLLRVNSTQITLKRESLLKTGIKFDERFGLGSNIYNSGEENLLLAQMYDKGLKIYHVPIVISNHITEDDSNSIYNEKLIFGKAAFFRAYDKHKCLLYMILLYFLKKKIIDKNISFRKYIDICLKGIKDYDKRNKM